MAWLATPAATAETLSRGRWARVSHLTLLSHYLADAAFGEIALLIVEMPPRHGKSELTSHWFPAWYLTLNPTKRIILASYEADFAASWGRKVRSTIEANSERLGISVDRRSHAAHRWDLVQGGGMVTAGVRGPITGKGGDLIVVDDPIKNFEEAYSATYRKRTLDWWTSTLRTRLEPGGSIVLVMTRWHEDDLAASVKRDADCTELRLPAVCEDETDAIGRVEGEPLWPARYDGKSLQKIRVDVGELVWAGLYQQRPAPLEGGIFKRAWLRFWYIGDEPPPPVMFAMNDGGIHVCEQQRLPKRFDEHLASWDLPFKGKSTSDMVAGQVWSRRGADCYLRDQLYGRMDFPAQKKGFELMAQRWPDARRKLIEDAANGAALVSTLKAEIPGIVPVPPKGSKEARAAAVSAVFESGNVYLPHPTEAPWVNGYIEELATFPGARYDDQVDATTQALARLANSAVARLKRLATK